jgi:hypothetical protein
MRDQVISHGLNADETRIHPWPCPAFVCFVCLWFLMLRSRAPRVFQLLGPLRFLCRSYAFLCIPMHFLCDFYTIPMHFLYRLLLNHMPFSARIWRYCPAKKTARKERKPRGKDRNLVDKKMPAPLPNGETKQGAQHREVHCSLLLACAALVHKPATRDVPDCVLCPS